VVSSLASVPFERACTLTCIFYPSTHIQWLKWLAAGVWRQLGAFLSQLMRPPVKLHSTSSKAPTHHHTLANFIGRRIQALAAVGVAAQA
jgi:hypothetical protein